MTKKVAVILSGCGFLDGSEIQETVLMLFAISKHNTEYVVFAPDQNQTQVVNHKNGTVTDETRNILIESARIVRGDIFPLSALIVSDFDALFLPGGYGAAKNLSDFAFKGNEMIVLPELQVIIREFYQLKKPIGVICITPVVVAKSLGKGSYTTGNDPDSRDVIQNSGCLYTDISVPYDIVIDFVNRIVSAPCYMHKATVYEIGMATEKVVQEVLRLIKE